MAKQRSHLSISFILSALYIAVGFLLFRLHPEILLLGGILVVICGVLPNIDAGPDSESGQQFISLTSTIVPLLIISFFPELRTGGIARVALTVVVSFFLARAFLRWSLGTFFVRRGLLHSIPAAIIIGEVAYLIFFDLFPKERIYLALGAFLGFLSHLLLDATMNIDLVGNRAPRSPVLKLAGHSWWQTTLLYTTVVVLGWFVLKDVYPQFKLYGGVSY